MVMMMMMMMNVADFVVVVIVVIIKVIVFNVVIIMSQYRYSLIIIGIILFINYNYCELFSLLCLQVFNSLPFFSRFGTYPVRFDGRIGGAAAGKSAAGVGAGKGSTGTEEAG